MISCVGEDKLRNVWALGSTRGSKQKNNKKEQRKMKKKASMFPLRVAERKFIIFSRTEVGDRRLSIVHASQRTDARQQREALRVANFFVRFGQY